MSTQSQPAIVNMLIDDTPVNFTYRGIDKDWTWYGLSLPVKDQFPAIWETIHYNLDSHFSQKRTTVINDGSFYFWVKAKMDQPTLIDRLIECGLKPAPAQTAPAQTRNGSNVRTHVDSTVHLSQSTLPATKGNVMPSQPMVNVSGFIPNKSAEKARAEISRITDLAILESVESLEIDNENRPSVLAAIAHQRRAIKTGSVTPIKPVVSQPVETVKGPDQLMQEYFDLTIQQAKQQTRSNGSQPAKPETVKPENHYCDNCGSQVKATSKFCPTCGSKLAEYETVIVSAPVHNVQTVKPVQQTAPAQTVKPAIVKPATPVHNVPAQTVSQPAKPVQAGYTPNLNSKTGRRHCDKCNGLIKSSGGTCAKCGHNNPILGIDPTQQTVSQASQTRSNGSQPAKPERPAQTVSQPAQSEIAKLQQTVSEMVKHSATVDAQLQAMYDAFMELRSMLVSQPE